VLEAVRPIQPGLASPGSIYETAEPQWKDGDAGALSVVENLFGPSPVPVDEIIRLSGASSGAVQMALLELDLAGRLDRHAGGRVSLRPA
jgi:DNA processing protein